MDLQIGDFSTLFEIAATLNVAFIAVEYSTSYTIAVARNVFRLFDKIDQNILRCKSHIDEDTISGLNDVKVNGHSIAHKIEKAKRESVVLKRDLRTLREELRLSIKEKCKLKCFSMICLHLFLYCLAACVTMALEEETNVKPFWTIFSILSILYVSVTFWYGEIKGKAPLVFQNLKVHAGNFFLVVILGWAIQFIIPSGLYFLMDSLWTYTVISTALYPYIFFILFIFVLKSNSKEINEDIIGKTDALEIRCIKLEEEVKALSSVQQISIEVDGLPDSSLHADFAKIQPPPQQE